MDLLTAHARALVGEAQRVYAAFPNRKRLATVQLTDPNRSMVNPMYLDDLAELIWFRNTIQAAKRLDSEAYSDLPRQIAIIKDEFGLN